MQEASLLPLNPDARGFLRVLEHLRVSRGFDAVEVGEAKVARIVEWFRQEGLDSAVVGVSGGVDSALVLALLMAARHAAESPIRRVIALLLPIESAGATGQEEASALGRMVAEKLGAEVWEAPLGGALRTTVAALSSASNLPFSAWAEGQCLSVMRTPALYGAAALLQAHGYRSVVAGTTNRDEGAYLGFFGKASDGMVDLQPISDLHKSEVRRLAKSLDVPRGVVDRAPSGDVFDGRLDEQMIGASYDDVELYLRLRELGCDPTALGTPNAAAIESQHAKNAHKYRVGDPAVHLDVMPRGVPGGWSDAVLSGRTETRPPPGVLPGEWDPPPLELRAFTLSPWERLALPEGLALRVRRALSDTDCGRLVSAMEQSGQAEPVGVTGVRDLRDAYGVGSVRATAWSPPLARSLWTTIAHAVPSVRFLDEKSPTDGFGTEQRRGFRSWRVVGLSPVLRLMRYEPGGKHLCHYDAGFDYGDGRRTLMSVVFYLTDAAQSGATRFVRDGQEGKRAALRDFSDWSRDTRLEEVLCSVFPKRGDVLVFDHRLCHDVEEWRGPGARVIVRGDVVYEAIPDGRL